MNEIDVLKIAKSKSQTKGTDITLQLKKGEIRRCLNKRSNTRTELSQLHDTKGKPNDDK